MKRLILLLVATVPPFLASIANGSEIPSAKHCSDPGDDVKVDDSALAAMDCSADWILGFYNRIAETGNRSNPDDVPNDIMPVLPSVVACIILAWQEANLRDLTREGYFRESWQDWEKSQYHLLARELLLQPPIGEAGLVVSALGPGIRLNDLVLDVHNGVAYVDFYLLLNWHDTRLDPSSLKKPLDKLVEHMSYIDNDVLTETIWKPQVVLPFSSYHASKAKYTRLFVFRKDVHAVLSFAGFPSHCILAGVKRDQMRCKSQVIFGPVWSSDFSNLLEFRVDAKNWRGGFRLESHFTHPPEWRVENTSIATKKFNYSLDVFSGLEIQILLARSAEAAPSTSETGKSTRSTSTSDYTLIDENKSTPTTSTSDYVHIDEAPSTLSRRTSFETSPSSSADGAAPHAGSDGVRANIIFAASAVVAAAPLIGAHAAGVFAMKAIAIAMLQPVFIAHLMKEHVLVPGTFIFLQYFILASLLVDAFVFRVIERVRQGLYRVPPPRRVVMIAAALVRRFAWIIPALAQANLPQAELPPLPILGGDGDVEGGRARQLNNFANEWLVVVAAAYIAWLGLATVVLLGMLVAFTVA